MKTCEKHCYCRSKVVDQGIGKRPIRVRYCCWCGKERGKS